LFLKLPILAAMPPVVKIFYTLLCLFSCSLRTSLLLYVLVATNRIKVFFMSLALLEPENLVQESIFDSDALIDRFMLVLMQKIILKAPTEGR